MPRKLRIHFPGAVYHVIMRGNAGQMVFHDDEDRVCTPLIIQRYRSRISGSLLDRIDIHIEVPAESTATWPTAARARAPAPSRRAWPARARCRRRALPAPRCAATQMTARMIRKFCETDQAGNRMLEVVTDRLGPSARSYTRILKVARTIADLDGSVDIREQHIFEAIQYRSLDRKRGIRHDSGPIYPAPGNQRVSLFTVCSVLQGEGLQSRFMLPRMWSLMSKI